MPKFVSKLSDQSRTRLALTVIGVTLFVASVTALNGDEARGGGLVVSALLLALAALLPLLRGRIRLGPLETELREEVAETIEETGRAEGIDPEKIDRLSKKVDQLLDRPAVPAKPGTRKDIMVCANCGQPHVLKPSHAGDLIQPTISTGPICSVCNSPHFRLPD